MKSVLITGVSSGIGLETARKFIENNYRVFGSVRKEKDANQVREELGANFVPLIFDLTNKSAIQKSAKLIEARLEDENLAGLINNAGIAVAGPLMHVSEEEMRKQFEVNVIGQLNVIQAFLPLLGASLTNEKPTGKILNISSVAGKIALPFMGPYAASKFALEGLSHALRRELMLYGIDVIIVRPGLINTPIWDKAEDNDRGEYDDTDFGEAARNFKEFSIEEGKKGYTAEAFGTFLLKIFEKRKPKTSYTFIPNKLKNWVAPSILPDRALDNFLAKDIGLI